MKAKTKIAAAAVVIVAIAVAATALPTERWLLQLVGFIRGAGAVGVLAYVATYWVATVALLPGSIITLAAGFAYGPLWGTALVVPTATIGATFSFLIGRFFARGWVAHKVAGSARFRAIDRAIGKSGFKIVLLLRLSPVLPFSLLNYALGVTGVRTRDYFLASLLGMIPGTAMYVYLGSLVTSASQLAAGAADGGAAQQALYWGGLVATVLVTVLLTRLARRELRAVLDAPDAAGDEP